MRVLMKQLVRAITNSMTPQRRGIKCGNRKDDPPCVKRAPCKRFKRDPCELFPECPKPKPCEILEKDTKKRYMRRKKFIKELKGEPEI